MHPFAGLTVRTSDRCVRIPHKSHLCCPSWIVDILRVGHTNSPRGPSNESPDRTFGIDGRELEGLCASLREDRLGTCCGTLPMSAGSMSMKTSGRESQSASWRLIANPLIGGVRPRQFNPKSALLYSLIWFVASVQLVACLMSEPVILWQLTTRL
jgi:hypothetical protein